MGANLLVAVSAWGFEDIWVTEDIWIAVLARGVRILGWQ